VHQLVTGADLDALDTAWGELRAAGWPVPEDPESDEDIELDGQALIADCLNDEVGWLRRCAGWIAQLDAGGSPSAVALRPTADGADTAPIAVDLARVRAIIERIAADIDEFARARRVDKMDTAAIRSDRPAPRRGRAAEPDRGFREFCPRTTLPASATPQLERAWDAWQTERHRRGEIDQQPAAADNPFRPR
jgi:hypothetical protein